MFNLVIEIKAPEIVNAIWALIGTLTNAKIEGAPIPTPSNIPTIPQAQQVPPQQIQAQPQQSAPAQQQFQLPAQMQPQPPAQLMPQQQVQQQMPPMQQPLPGPVPTAAQTFTLDQLAVAATALSDSGKRAEVLALLGAFGVQMLTALPQEQYGNFATHLRSLGAKI